MTKKIWDDRQTKKKIKPNSATSTVNPSSALKQKGKDPLRKQKNNPTHLRINWLYVITLKLTLSFIAAGVVASYYWVFKDLPSPRNLTQQTFPVSTEIFDRRGQLLYEIFSDQNRKPILLGDIPAHLKQATIAIEDQNFYRHSGFDVDGIMRALYKNISNQSLQGGSTITQQLVKTALLSPEQTVQRKLKELVLAWFTELIYTKDEILEMYLNHIPYGGTAYGVEQAALLYFDKPAKDLTLAQSALLAGLPQAPSRYSPFGANPELAKERQLQVLRRMQEDGYISPQQQQEAEAEKLQFALKKTDIKAPHFVMYVKDLLVEKYGQVKVEQGGLRVTTSLDYELQEIFQASVSAEIEMLTNYQVSNGAALVTHPATGEILAMIGSRNYWDNEIDGNVNLTTSLRQPGSSIKPLNYALGLLKGYTASTLFLDIPTCFQAPGQPTTYCPKNYDGKFHGPQQLRYSLANSYNIPAVKMLALNGIESFIATASAMGISTWKDSSNYGLSLTLGGGEVKMTDLATAFGVFANSGIRIDLNPILKVETYKGEILEKNDHEQNPPAGKRVLPPEVTWIISNILADNGARIPAFGANSELVIPNKTVSVKTGTTDDLRDNWTVGYTPEFLVTVWVGNNDNSKMNPYVVSGVTGAAPIWNDLMTWLLRDREDVIPPKPLNVIGANVCAYATRPNPENPSDPGTCEGRFEYYIRGTEHDQLAGKIEIKNIWIDKETGQPPKEGKTENLELQERMVITDKFSREYCANCTEANQPQITVNLEQLQQRLEEEKNQQKNNSIK